VGESGIFDMNTSIWELFRIRIVLFTVLVLGINAAHAESLKFDRFWEEHDFGYALVTYTNNTKATFNTGVTIKCIAIGKNGAKINTNRRSFYAHEYGPIKPGFSGTLKIPIRLYGLSLKSMKCKAIENK